MDAIELVFRFTIFSASRCLVRQLGIWYACKSFQAVCLRLAYYMVQERTASLKELHMRPNPEHYQALQSFLPIHLFRGAKLSAT